MNQGQKYISNIKRVEIAKYQKVIHLITIIKKQKILYLLQTTKIQKQKIIPNTHIQKIIKQIH